MSLVINLLIFFWFTRTIKFVLFWIYLWQLKEYHVGRFVDHFRTNKGKKLIFDRLLIIKLILIIFLLANYYFFPSIFYILLVIYAAESSIFIFNILNKSIKKPVSTIKTVLIILVSLVIIILYLIFAYNYIKTYFVLILYVLSFDILTPLIVSIIVLTLQPFFVFARNSVLEKAKNKISKFKKLTVIGITGSYGKTSTKEFLKTILSQKFNVLATPEHNNSEIGISKCILKDLNNEHEIFIVEMGSYNKGGINLLCNIVKPKIGIVTGVNEQHLSTFGSMENLLSAEGGRELAKALPLNGLIVLNGDNKYCLDLYKKVDIRKKIYTVKKGVIDSDIWTEGANMEKELVSFIAATKQKEMINIDVNVLGLQNVQNILASIIVAKELGMSLEEIAKACRSIKQEQAGIVLKKGIHGINIIDSSYSSNPDGVMADLNYLNIFPGKKVIVMPCLIELGNKSAEIHRHIGKKIAEVCDMAIITTKDKFEEIKKGATETLRHGSGQGGMPSKNIIFCDNSNQILNLITTFCKENDTVLLEGRVPGELIKLLNK